MLSFGRSCSDSQLGSWGRNKSFVCVVVGHKSNKRGGDGALRLMDPLGVLLSSSLNKSESKIHMER